MRAMLIVYTLWHNPGLVPLLHTPESVLQKLRNGADLMTPGLARGPPFPVAATKGSVVAIASLDTPSVPMVVGVCEIDVGELKAVAGEKGRAVRGMHWEGDELWAWSSGGRGGGANPTALEGWILKGEDGLQDLAAETDKLRMDDADIETEDDGGVPLGDFEGSNPRHDTLFEREDAPPFKDKQVEGKELSTKGSFINRITR
jgi:translation initiation factor 2D